MNLDEALAAYLYLQHQRRDSVDELRFKEAWKIICDTHQGIVYRALSLPNGTGETHGN